MLSNRAQSTGVFHSDNHVSIALLRRESSNGLVGWDLQYRRVLATDLTFSDETDDRFQVRSRMSASGSSSRSKATTNAVRSCLSFGSDSAPIKSVSILFSRRVIWSQLMTESCFKPSSTPTCTSVDKPTPDVLIGAHRTRLAFESRRSWRLTTAKQRDFFGSPCWGRRTR